MPQPADDSRLFDIMWTCRAMRRLKPDPVPEEILLQLVDAALHGPSGSNAQNWRFVIVRDRAQKEKIQALWQKTWGFYLDTFATAGLRPGETHEQREKTKAIATELANHIADVPALIFVCVARDEQLAKALASPATVVKIVKHFGVGGAARMAMSGPRISGLADGSTAYPAVQNILLSARALGLGAVLTTQHFFVPGEFEAAVGLPSTVTLAAVIPVGYPKGKFGPVQRPDPRAVVSWDRYDG
ncbi:MAG TPA: nitroreductase family protein [Candidatus Limnocylindrales bacterium]|nr:nitroreductase family protein [Candidatus Limnocylindrales bacterium]